MYSAFGECCVRQTDSPLQTLKSLESCTLLAITSSCFILCVFLFTASLFGKIWFRSLNTAKFSLAGELLSPTKKNKGIYNFLTTAPQGNALTIVSYSVPDHVAS